LAAIDEFLTMHRGAWEELERLISRAGRDPRRLDAEQIERLSQLYRRTTADLALARRDFPGTSATRYLNDLAGRTHPLLYRAPAGSWRRLMSFFVIEFPRRFLAARAFILTALLLFALPAAGGYLVTVNDPAAAEQVLPAALSAKVREGRLWVDIEEEQRSLAASTIMTNNLKVGILAFAGGILLGTLTVYVMVMNGVMMGSVFGYTSVYGLLPDLAAFVSPHGYLELSVVFIAGAAGLQLAWAIVSPGLLRRRDSLARAAQEAVLLLVGAAPWLVLAGLIEGFVSPSDLPREVKLALGPLTALLLYGFIWRGRALSGRPARRSEPAARLELEVGRHDLRR
jgi:uncharacterized membrane protein SpoIIM required for sporulation